MQGVRSTTQEGEWRCCCNPNHSASPLSVDIVSGSPNGMFALWTKTRNPPLEVRPVAYTSRRFRDRNPILYRAVYEPLKEATEPVRTNLRSASQRWIEDSASKPSIDFGAAAGAYGGTEWTPVPLATLHQAELMFHAGALKVKPAT